MDYIEYTQIKKLIKKYTERYSIKLSSLENDLAKELFLKTESLDDISKEIVLLVDDLLPVNKLLPNESDEFHFMNTVIKLQRADPAVPIKLDNITIAYTDTEGKSNILHNIENKKKENKLQRLTIEFYQTAFRIIKITEKIPHLNKFTSNGVRDIRNHLIEHPEGKASRITFNSFSYSKNDGPYIKGVRRNNEINFMDRGFKVNSQEFISNFTKVLKKACD